MADRGERRRVLACLEERFGIPETVFDGYLLFRRRRNWLMLKYSGALPSAAGLKITKMGLKAFRDIGAFVKPSTRLIQLFGGYATRARLVIDKGQLARLINGEELVVDLDLDTGYVILVLKDAGILGLGFYINGRLRSQLPVKEIRSAMLGDPLTGDEQNCGTHHPKKPIQETPHADKGKAGKIRGRVVVGAQNGEKGTLQEG